MNQEPQKSYWNPKMNLHIGLNTVKFSMQLGECHWLDSNAYIPTDIILSVTFGQVTILSFPGCLYKNINQY